MIRVNCEAARLHREICDGREFGGLVNNTDRPVFAMEAHDFRPCPFCAHDKPIVVAIPGDQPAFIIARPECGASGPKQLPGVPLEIAVDSWNRRYGMDH